MSVVYGSTYNEPFAILLVLTYYSNMLLFNGNLLSVECKTMLQYFINIISIIKLKNDYVNLKE